MRINSLATALLAVIALAVFAATGCDNTKPENGKSAKNGDAAHDHDHDHDDEDAHDDHPAHGPNHGHIFKLDTADMQGEWRKYPDNDVIRMYLLDAKGETNTPMKVDSFTVTPKVGSEEESFVLAPEEPDADGATAVYMLDDKNLSIAIPLGVDIEIKAGDKTYKGEIKAHEPLDH